MISSTNEALIENKEEIIMSNYFNIFISASCIPRDLYHCIMRLYSQIIIIDRNGKIIIWNKKYADKHELFTSSMCCSTSRFSARAI